MVASLLGDHSRPERTLALRGRRRPRAGFGRAVPLCHDRPMPRAELSSGIELEYETFGDPTDPTLLLVCGYTSQMRRMGSWAVRPVRRPGPARRAVRQPRRRVCRASSTGSVNPMKVLAAMMAGEAPPTVPVHAVAHGRRRDRTARSPRRRPSARRWRVDGWDDRADHGDRASRSSGEPHLDHVQHRRPSGGAGRRQRPARHCSHRHRSDREAYIDASTRYAVWASKKSRRPRRDAGSVPQRTSTGSFYPQGAIRQLAAIYASGDRTDALGDLDVPTLVIHGRDDTLITPSGGEATAAAIAGSKYLLLADMGHDLPQPLWPVFAEAIGGHVRTTTLTPTGSVPGTGEDPGTLVIHFRNPGEPMPGPLAGHRIIEIAGIGPGPFAAMLLADLGAEVDPRRPGRRSPWPGSGSAPTATCLLRGRRNVAVDLKHPDGVATLLDLVEHADALIEGFRPGVIERLGIGPDECMARNPKLVFGRMTGWGQTGPYSQAAGHDINYISLAGALAHFGRSGEAPTPPLNMVGDFGGGGMFLALGVVSALLEASKSGKGQVVDTAMVDGSACSCRCSGRSRVDGHLRRERSRDEPARHGCPLLRRVRVQRRRVRVDRFDRAAVLRRTAPSHGSDGRRAVRRPRWTRRTGTS